MGVNVLGRLLMELREQFKRANGEDLKRVEPVPIGDFLLYDKPIGIVQAWRVTGPNLTDPDLTPSDGALWDHVEELSPMNNPTENTFSAEPNDKPEAVSPAPVELPANPVLAEADTCYSRCLPLLLQYLQKEIPSEKLPGIAERLRVLPQQLKAWLECGIRDGIVEKTKKKRKVIYVPVAPKQDPKLVERNGILHEIQEAVAGTP